MDRVYLQGLDSSQFIELPKLLYLGERSETEQLFHGLTKAHNSGDTLRTSILLWEIFLSCAEIYRKDSPRNVYVSRIKKYIDGHYHEEISSADIEKLCGISYKHICAVFKENTGMTVKKYLIGARLKAACRLIAETPMSVSEISEAVGMGDVYYFSRIFKREKGCSPSRYRKDYVPRI